MSFDLYVIDHPDSDVRTEELVNLVLDETPNCKALVSSIQAAVDEFSSSFPGLDVDPDSSPWNSWPLEANACADGSACAFNIAWSQSDRMLDVFIALCSRRGLFLYDPQTDELYRPRRKHHFGFRTR